MATQNELAIFSYNTYSPSDKNFISVSGWDRLSTLNRPDHGSGFDGTVFVSQSQSHGGSSEIVIAFRGTDADSVPTAAADWLRGNIPAAGGYSSAQVRRAIEMVADVMAAYPGARITLTGHSLGGGLASLMAVFFDLEAVVFDPAPFAYSAIDVRYIPAVPPVTTFPILIPSDLVESYFGDYETYQFERGGLPDINSAFQQYRTTLATGSTEQISELFLQRESRVTGTYVEGEILAPIRQLLPTIIDPAGLTPIPIGNTTLNDAPLGSAESVADGTSLHSALLMAALRISPDLATASQGHPALLELLLDGGLYATKNDAPATGFLNRLVTEQMRAGVQPGQGMLDRFAQDVVRLGTDGTTNHSLVRDALLATVIEYYRFANPADTTPFVQLTDDAISFDMSRLPQGSGTQDGSSLRAGRNRLLAGLEALAASPATARIRAAADAASIWTIQTGTGGLTTLGGITNEVQIGSENSVNDLSGGSGNDMLMNGNAGGNINGGDDADVLIGGNGIDWLRGGDGTDYLSGGDNTDHLFGGAGRDELRGGEGNDSYYFSLNDGSDVILDSDGSGKILIDISGTEQIQLTAGAHCALQVAINRRPIHCVG
jgi:pimeloyl-ACP methyl ester carboxylesterase